MLPKLLVSKRTVINFKNTRILCKHNPNFPINQTDLKMLFSFATTQSYFLFNVFIYDQIDGVAMGSPLAPISANLFMGYHEKS